MNFNNLLKIKLRKDSKNPVERWTKPSNQYKHIDNAYYNAGVPMGPNKLLGIDLDSAKWSADHVWFKKFGIDLEAFCVSLNTLAVKTPCGGFHLYFEYDENLPQTQSAEHQIDIRRDNGYLVCPPSYTSVGKYECISDHPPTKIPPELCEFLYSILYDNSSDIVESKKLKDLRAAKKQRTGNKEVLNQYKYVISDELFENRVLKKLDSKWFTDYTYWLKFTTALKHLDKKTLWEQYCHANKGFNEEQNETIWNSINCDYSVVECLLKDTKSNELLVYSKFKPLPVAKKIPDHTVNLKKLGVGFFQPGENVVVKSDTGTGKTTSFLHFAKNYKKPFISITSRISLAQEQYEVFSKNDIECELYQHVDAFYDFSKGIITCIDSIRKLENVTSSKYVLFLDEWNSICEYILQSLTLKHHRTDVFEMLLELINDAEQVIAVDADISDMSFEFLSGIKFTYIQNSYQHNKDVVAEEVEKFDSIIDIIKKTPKYLVCCDSKTTAENIYLECRNEENDITLITADTKDYIDLDSADRIIFSPKIIYGLDSTMRRPVFCVYREYTISPSNMVQQISRCRNIKHLYYYFNGKRFQDAKFTTIDDVCETIGIEEKFSIGWFSRKCPESLNNLFLKVYCQFLYKQDCFNTNKFLHFKNIIQSRGMKDSTQIMKSVTKIDTKLEKERVTLWKKENFSRDAEFVTDINQSLGLTEDADFEKFKDYFIDSVLLNNHFNIVKFFFKHFDMVTWKYFSKETEFGVKKLEQDRAKMKFLSEFSLECGFERLENGEFQASKVISEELASTYSKRYDIIFHIRKNRHNSKRLDGTVQKSLQFIALLMDSIFGRKFVAKKDTRYRAGHRQSHRQSHRQVYRLGEPYELSKQLFSIKDPDWADKIDIYHHISQSSVPVADTVAVPSPAKRKALDTDVN